MIITKLQGGLGNQLFQWAFAKNLSIKYNMDMFLDLNFYNLNLSGVTKREFSLNKFPYLKFNYKYEINTSNTYKICDNFNFKPINILDSNSYYLDGYWQSEKYFKESEDIIRNELYPDDRTLYHLNKTPFIDKNVVSMHIRRTDYVTSNGYHPIQSIEYYEKALNIIGEYDYIFVFSDDIQWCKNNLTFDKMIFISGNDDVYDLWLMSLCKKNIIANSSFSWWGAWLNSNKDKKVISPINWIGNHININTKDIVPDTWIKI